MKFAKRIALFGIGGSAYVGLELLYRGHSHISMFGAGGLCFLLIGQLKKLRLPQTARIGCGTGIITAVELMTGLLVNRNYQVWDYRGQPGNFLGQICPMFMALWVPVTVMAMGLYTWVDAGLDRIMGHMKRKDRGGLEVRRR